MVVTNNDIVIGRTGSFVRVDDEYIRKTVDEKFPLIREYMGRSDIEPTDVIVRGTLIINSARDYYYSRFSDSAMHEVAEMLPGRPVMANHTYGMGSLGLPLGRFFDANVVTRRPPSWTEKDSKWVEGLFYLPNDDEGQRIARRIDLGIYKETSLGWRCSGADCSVCGEDVRSCGHIPGEIYERAGIAEMSFSGITGVLEGSLVYSGGQKSTTTFVPAGERSAPQDGVLWSRIADYKRESIERGDSIDSILKRGHGDAPVRRSLFAVECGRERFNRQQAARWIREHGFRADKIEETKGGWSFAQKDIPRGGFSVKAIRLEDDVEGLMLKERSPKRSDDDLGAVLSR